MMQELVKLLFAIFLTAMISECAKIGLDFHKPGIDDIEKYKKENKWRYFNVKHNSSLRTFGVILGGLGMFAANPNININIYIGSALVGLSVIIITVTVTWKYFG